MRHPGCSPTEISCSCGRTAGGGGVVPLMAPRMPTAGQTPNRSLPEPGLVQIVRSWRKGRCTPIRRESEGEGVACVATDCAFMVSPVLANPRVLIPERQVCEESSR